ncbi:hypothetical protein Ddye_028565 [Dipteronia dyeriana]|uniref:SPX domain-containing protein n=1 Tax=Dipteronia dyeriana TaxID=168575 RepID=A0AAD9TDY7_9ROSI|nr:hypothetical protein Ddye_028565 [Dipteronia dyeriana]
MEKFSKQFEGLFVPKWKETFVDYWKLKKDLKKIYLLNINNNINNGSGSISKPDVLEFFYDLCIKEVEQGHRPGTHFTKVGWDNLVKNFNKTTGNEYNKVQLKNRWDTLKSDWKLWRDLIGKETGLGWNAKLKTIDALEEWWHRKLQVGKTPLMILEYFKKTIRDPVLNFLKPLKGEKYYLVDAGYPQMSGYLGPYKGERYHTPDFRRGRQPTGPRELFNQAHSSLRNVIECTFGRHTQCDSHFEESKNYQDEETGEEMDTNEESYETNSPGTQEIEVLRNQIIASLMGD